MLIKHFPIFVLLLGTSAFAAAPDEQVVQFFESRVRPVLTDHCYKCHSDSAKKLKGELHLDSREGVLAGGKSGPVVVLGHPEQSVLIQAIQYTNPELQMPPKDKLNDQEIADLSKWITMGLPWQPGQAPPRSSIVRKSSFDLEQRKASHWAWRPVKPPALRAFHRERFDDFDSLERLFEDAVNLRHLFHRLTVGPFEQPGKPMNQVGRQRLGGFKHDQGYAKQR